MKTWCEREGYQSWASYWPDRDSAWIRRNWRMMSDFAQQGFQEGVKGTLMRLRLCPCGMKPNCLDCRATRAPLLAVLEAKGG